MLGILSISRFSPYKDLPMEISCLSTAFDAYSITWLHTSKTDQFQRGWSIHPSSFKSPNLPFQDPRQHEVLAIWGSKELPFTEVSDVGYLSLSISRSSGTIFLPRGGSPSHNPRLCFRLLGPLPLGCVGISLLGESKLSLQLAYRHATRASEDLGPFLRLCLLDHSFPAFVEQVEKELCKIAKEKSSNLTRVIVMYDNLSKLESMHNTYIGPAGSSSAEQKESGEGHREKRKQCGRSHENRHRSKVPPEDVLTPPAPEATERQRHV
ncbi:RE114 protein, partial [Polyodon spathula]|nr:RE114 protein [Polyodon spathula]